LPELPAKVPPSVSHNLHINLLPKIVLSWILAMKSACVHLAIAFDISSSLLAGVLEWNWRILNSLKWSGRIGNFLSQAGPFVWGSLCNGTFIETESELVVDSKLQVDCWLSESYGVRKHCKLQYMNVQTSRRKCLIPVWNLGGRLNRQDLWFITVKNCKQEHN
jgi:hypothetical protein